MVHYSISPYDRICPAKISTTSLEILLYSLLNGHIRIQHLQPKTSTPYCPQLLFIPFQQIFLASHNPQLLCSSSEITDTA